MTARNIFTSRPEGVDPDWWARAPWSAKQRAAAAALRARAEAAGKTREQIERAIEAARLADAAAMEERLQHGAKGTRMPYQKRAEQVLDLLEKGLTPVEIVLDLGVTAGSIDMALRRAKDPDTARLFGRLRSNARLKDPCPTCGKPKRTAAKQCKTCQAATTRARTGAPTSPAQPGQDHRKDTAA